MAGDILREERLTMAEAAQALGVHVNTIHRWRLRGVRGIRLSCAAIGQAYYTSRERIAVFIEQTTAAANGEAAPAPRSNRERERAITAAERELAAAGA